MRGITVGMAMALVAWWPVCFGNQNPGNASAEAVQVAGASDQTRKRFAELEERLRRLPDTDAVDEVLRWMEEEGEVLIQVDSHRYVPARYWGQVLLSRLSPQQLQTYRLRVDPLAEQMLARARQGGDQHGLRWISERYGLSRPALQALLLSGDALLERGEAAAARALWEHLHPEGTAEWTHPDVRLNQNADLVAQVIARQGLALWLEGEVRQAREHCERLRQQFPQARGRLAGQEGVYHELLAELLRNPPAYPRPWNVGRSWNTFGSRPTRNPSLALSYRPGENRPTWRRELSLVPRVPAEGELAGFRQPWPHAVAAEGCVFLTDGFRLYAFDALNGRPHATLELLAPPPFAREVWPPGMLACPTLTLEGNGLYLRTGLPLLRPAGARGDPGWTGRLVHVQIQRHEKNGVTLQKRWFLIPPIPNAFWEGAPLVVGRKLWAAYGRFEGGRLHHGVACYDPADAANPPALRWQAEVSISPWLPLSAGRTRLELLTWADGRIVFNTNSGVVMALDAATGQRLWAFRYPRASRSTSQDTLAQPAPAIYDDGRVFVAPTDSDGIFALDAHDGRLLWQLRGLEGVLLHAVTARHVFATVRRPLPALMAVNVQTGSPRRSEGGWFVPLRDAAAESALSLVTLHHLLYPTRAGMLALRHEDGTPSFDPVSDQLPLANYLMVDGILIAVTPQHLVGCISERLRLSLPP
jgi:hypothetical protein